MGQLLHSFLVPIVVLGVALLMMVIEAVAPGRTFPKVTGWYTRAIALNLAQVGVIVLGGYAWDPWLRTVRPWSAETLGPWGGAALGYFAMTFVFYWWHRVRHTNAFLWRWFHQVHHSPQRLTVITSFYKHPLEQTVDAILSSLVCYGLVGCTPEQAGNAFLISGLAELYYHWNRTTPYWTGYLFQRPESHLVHHQREIHFSNFSDIPLWDILFGTFENPRAYDSPCGFETRDETKLVAMLAGVDVHAPRKDVAS